MPTLDERVLKMTSSKDYFIQVAELAQKVEKLARSANEDDDYDSDLTTKLSQHPLVRAIGFVDTVRYLTNVYKMLLIINRN